MADEITLYARLGVANGNLRDSRDIGSVRVDQAAAGLVANVQTIGFAAHEALVLGDVASVGFAHFQNLSSSAAVSVGIDDTGTFEPVVTMLPGEPAGPFRLAGAPYAKADTAVAKLAYLILET